MMRHHSKVVTLILALALGGTLPAMTAHAQELTHTYANGEALQMTSPGDYKLDDFTGNNDLSSTSAWVLKQPIRMFVNDTLSGLGVSNTKVIHSIHHPSDEKLQTTIDPWGQSYDKDTFTLTGNHLSEPYSVKIFYNFGSYELLQAQLPILVYPQPQINATGPFTIYQGGKFVGDDRTIIQDPWINQSWTGNNWLNQTTFANDGGTITNDATQILGDQDQHTTAAPGAYQVTYHENTANNLTDSLALKSSVQATEKWQVLATPTLNAATTAKANTNTAVDLTQGVTVADANHSDAKLTFGQDDAVTKPKDSDMTVQLKVLDSHQNPVSLTNLSAQKFKSAGQYTIQYSYHYTDQFDTDYAPITTETKLTVTGSSASTDQPRVPSNTGSSSSSSTTANSDSTSSSSSSAAASNAPSEPSYHHGADADTIAPAKSNNQTATSQANRTTKQSATPNLRTGAAADQVTTTPSQTAHAATPSSSSQQTAARQSHSQSTARIPQLNETSSLSILVGGLVLLLGTLLIRKLGKRDK